MSVTKRLLDLARANLNALLERAADANDPRRRLLTLSDEELAAELERRKKLREAESKVSAARAHVDAPPPAGGDREARARAARDREARVKATREARVKNEAPRPKPEGPPRPGAGARPRPVPGREHLRIYYTRLEVEVGAPFDEIKAAYRRLMRRYHPDLHNQTPAKLKAATEVAQALTQAYNELEKALLGGPNRR
jgi:hypothetical protein